MGFILFFLHAIPVKMSRPGSGQDPSLCAACAARSFVQSHRQDSAGQSDGKTMKDQTLSDWFFFPKQCVTLRGSYGKGKAS